MTAGSATQLGPTAEAWWWRTCAGASARTATVADGPITSRTLVHDCYVKLLVPGGLDSFLPPPDRPLAVAFRAWLFGVVRYHCNNRLRQLGRDPVRNSDQPNPTDGHADSDIGARGVSGRMVSVSQEEEFARDCLRCLADGAVADVEARWRARRKNGAERFRVLLPIALNLGGSYGSASKELGILCNNARQLVNELREELERAVRTRVQDELRLEPGLSEESIKGRVDAAIKELFDAAFPGGHGLPPDFFRWRTKSEPADGTQPTDAPPPAEPEDKPPESKP